MSQDNAPLFKAAYLVPVKMFEEWQQQLSKKNDTFICHAASNAALYSNNALWTMTSLYFTGKNLKEAFKSCEK